MVIQPNAKKSEVIGLQGEPPRLKIKLKALPIEGKANKELIKFLSEILKIAKSRISLLRGETSKQKDIFLDIEKIPSFLEF